MKLEELEVYNLSMKLGEEVWDIVMKMQPFPREVMGKQMIKAADSIAANISEGFGRFHYKEHKMFLYYARGSLMETMTWIKKCKNRLIISENTLRKLSGELTNISVKLNNYIRSIGQAKNNHIQEPEVEYGEGI